MVGGGSRSRCRLAFTGTQRYGCLIITLKYSRFSLFVVVMFSNGATDTELVSTEPLLLGEYRVGFL